MQIKYYVKFLNTVAMLSFITRLAMLSIGVISLLIITKCFPLKNLIKEAAGYTVKDVPATINKSQFEM